MKPKTNINRPKPTKIDKKGIVVNKYTSVAPTRTGIDLRRWHNAIRMAEGVTKDRKPLYDIYKEALLNAHLKSVSEKRVGSITNSQFVFRNDNDEEDETINELINTDYFEKLLTNIVTSRFWGYSLSELFWEDTITDYTLGVTKLVDRNFVKPEWGKVVPNYGGKGEDYTQYVNCIGAGDEEDLGLYLQASFWSIIKQSNISDWVELAQSFGLPMVIGKYNDESTKEVLQQAFQELFAQGLVTPSSAEIDALLNSNTSNGDIFDNLRKAANSEISILILGQTMTTDEASSSGYAQSKTHADVEAGINKGDRRFVLRVLNTRLLPYLQAIGYNVRGKFCIVDEDSQTVSEKINNAIKLRNSGTPVDDNYLYEESGIPKPDNYDELIAKKEAEKEAQQAQQANNKFINNGDLDFFA